MKYAKTILLIFFVTWTAHWETPCPCQSKPPEIDVYTGQTSSILVTDAIWCTEKHSEKRSQIASSQSQVDDFEARCPPGECTDWQVILSTGGL